MLKLIDHLSSPSTKTELDLFTVPPTQVAVEKSKWREIPLSNACTNDGPYEFHIPAEPHMLHLYKNYITVEFRICHADGTVMQAADQVGPINLIGKTFFSQMRLFLNGTEVFNSSNKYAYRVFLETELNYGHDAKESQLQAALYEKDTPAGAQNNVDNIGNVGLASRSAHFIQSAWVQVMAPLHCDLFFQDRYLLNQIDVRLQLYRNNDRFLLVSFEQAPDYKMEIRNMHWLVKAVEIAPSVSLAIEKTLQHFTAKYPVRRVEIKTMNIAAGLRSTADNALFTGQLPRRLVIGCVDSDAFHGTYGKSPFNFKNYDIREVSVSAGGETFPSKPLQPHFATNQYMRSFVQLFEGLGFGGENKGNRVDRSSFKNGSCLFAFDLSPDEDDGSHWDLIKEGSVCVHINFGTALAQAVEVIVYAEFDNLLTIDKGRNPSIDYKT